MLLFSWPLIYHRSRRNERERKKETIFLVVYQLSIVLTRDGSSFLVNNDEQKKKSKGIARNEYYSAITFLCSYVVRARSKFWLLLLMLTLLKIASFSLQLYSRLANFLTDNVDKVRKLVEGHDHKRVFVLDVLLPEVGPFPVSVSVAISFRFVFILFVLSGFEIRGPKATERFASTSSSLRDLRDRQESTCESYPRLLMKAVRLLKNCYHH